MSEVAATPVSDGSRFAFRARLALLVVAGIGFRLWFVASPLGLVDGDEAVVGLMARRVLDGQFEAFYWGQEYGGSQESFLVALLLLVRVPGRWAMELVPVGLHAASALLVWRIGLRTIDRRGGAALAAGICWATSPALLWWSTKERGFYGFTLVCGLAALLLVLRLTVQLPWGCPSGSPKGNANAVARPQGQRQRDGVGLGLVLGLGWWASPQILHFAIPGLVWLAWTHRRHLGDLGRTLAIATPAAGVGALPWLWANAATGLASLEPAADRATFGDPLTVFFQYGVPMVLGLREPITLGWEFPGAVVVYAMVLAGLALVLLRWPGRLRPVLLSIGLFPLIFAALPTTYYFGEPRYLDFLWPLLALVAGWAVVRLPTAVQVGVLIALLVLTLNGVAGMVRLEGPPGEPFEDISPQDVGRLVLLLDTLEADRVVADYWVAYRLTWETEGRIVATPFAPIRDLRAESEVRKRPRAVFVVVASRCRGALQRSLSLQGAGFSVHTVSGVWDVVVPDEPLRLEVPGPTC